MSRRIILVEDDPDMRRVTRAYLERAGFRVTDVGAAEDVFPLLRRSLPDLVLSDIQLPGLSGTKLCQILRGEPRTASLPVILLTVMAKTPDKILGLQTGADDYVTKPYDPRELLARIETVLRRCAGAGRPSEWLECDELRVDLARREVTIKGKNVVLRRKEYELLVLFLKEPGRLLTRNHILHTLWGDEVVVTDNALSAHVANLRENLGSHGKRIHTLVGEGYRFEDR